jgi:hypothetical protein
MGLSNVPHLKEGEDKKEPQKSIYKKSETNKENRILNPDENIDCFIGPPEESLPNSVLWQLPVCYMMN